MNLQQGLRSDTLDSNIVVRPIGQVWSALIGEGIEVNRITTATTPEGFMVLEIRGYNKSHDIRRFEYRVEWLDPSGMSIGTKTSTWLMNSAMGKSDWTIRTIAPRKDAVDYRINTRKTKN